MSVTVSISTLAISKSCVEAGSAFESGLAFKYEKLVHTALQRMELLYGFPVSSWDKDFLKVDYMLSRLNLRVPYTDMTTLKTEESLRAFLEKLGEETLKLVQGQLYSDIIDNAENNGFKLQDEFVEEDETIVLTFETP